MASTTTMPRPADTAPAGAAPGKASVPAGAAKMQSWFVDKAGRHVRTTTPVPVDADNFRTDHLAHSCPKVTSAAGGGFKRCTHSEWLLPTNARFCPEHGERLTAPQTADRRRMLVKEFFRLHGASTAPWGLLAATAAAGVYTQTVNTSLLELAPIAPGVAVGTYLVTRTLVTRRELKAKRIERGQKAGRHVKRIIRTAKTAAVVAGAAGGWVAVAAATDVSTWPGRVAWLTLAAGWAIGSYPWWLRADKRRQRGTQAPADTAKVMPEPAPLPPDPVMVRAQATWNMLIGGAGKPLAGTELFDFQRLPACAAGGPDRLRLPNWTAKVRALVPGSINMREQRPTLVGRIAAAYGCTYGDVSFAADESDLSIAYLRVQPDNVLAEVRMYQGPAAANDWARGVTIVGRFEDGAPIRYQWYNQLGAVHALLSGCTGSGKSELVALLMSASLHSDGLVIDWLGDPQGGQSYGVLKDVVDYFARDKTEIVFMLLAAVKEMQRRNDELAHQNIKTWQPTREMPLLVITLDEVQSYIDDPIVLELVEMLVGQARKCGIAMRLITQVPYAYALGGSIYIKEQLMAGQAFTFRAATRTAGQAAADSDSPIDPTMLPDKWGKATCGAGEITAGLMFVQGIHGRDIYGRGDFTGRDMKVWLHHPDGSLSITPGVFGAAAQSVSGVLWGGRKARHAAAIAAGRNDSDLLRGGKAIELIEIAAAMSEGNNHTAAIATLNRAVEAQASQPEALKAKDTVLAAAATVVDAAGIVERPNLARATKGMPDGTFNKALGDLVADGKLRRVRNGVYELLGPRRQTTGDDNQSAA